MLDLLTLSLLAAAASPVAAFWRLPCKTPVVVERVDPIVVPGKVSGHVHTILGGNGFKPEMNYTDTQTSTCSSCTVVGDKSNYWVPALYFRHKNGSFESVQQNGGALIYYLQRAPQGVEMKAFPPNFRMVAGDPFKRGTSDDVASQAISYACIDFNAPGRPETKGFPNHNCANGLRQQVFFPSCWDGVNEDSKDHKSHVAYPVGGYNGGKCPESHPVNLISIFIEILWQTDKFSGLWTPGDGSNSVDQQQPFVLAHGDATGYGGHGDFLNGWDIPLLQRAIDTCTASSGNVEDCPVFKLIPDKQAEGCTVPVPHVDEQVFGLLDRLPGCNDVTFGPERAVPKQAPQAAAAAAAGTAAGTTSNSSSCGATTELSNKTAVPVPAPQGWTYLGCGTDHVANRAMTKARDASDDMTIAKCAAFCSGETASSSSSSSSSTSSSKSSSSSKKSTSTSAKKRASAGTVGPFKYFGTQYGRECYCDDDVRPDAMPVPGVPGTCTMPCAGNPAEMCGGYGVMSIFQSVDSDMVGHPRVGGGPDKRGNIQSMEEEEEEEEEGQHQHQHQHAAWHAGRARRIAS